MRFEWDPAKETANRRKHGLGFEEAKELFTSGVHYLELFDDSHSVDEDRFIAIGPIGRNVVLVVWTERVEDTGGAHPDCRRFALAHDLGDARLFESCHR